jgi:hypothetical protein
LRIDRPARGTLHEKILNCSSELANLAGALRKQYIGAGTLGRQPKRIRPTRKQDDLRGRARSAHQPDQLDTIDAGHFVVGNYDVERLFAGRNQAHGLFAALRGFHLISQIEKQSFPRYCTLRHIIDQEDFWARGCRTDRRSFHQD